MLSLRSDASMDLAEPLGRGALFGGHGAMLYAATLVVAALLVIVRFARFYAQKRSTGGAETSVEDLLDELDSEAGRSEAAPEDADQALEDEAAQVVEAPAPLVRFAVYDFDETLSRATYPQAYDGTPFGCMALAIPWDDPRAGRRSSSAVSATKEFGGFDDARIEQLQRHFAAMRAQGWTLCVLSYNLQWDKREFCLLKLLDHYGLLRYFTTDHTPLVWGLTDMRRVGATSKGDFVSKLVRDPARVAGLRLDCAPKGHMLIDDDEVNIAGARSNGILGYQVAKCYEWDGLVGGLGRADPHDFAKLEQVALAEPEAEVGERKRRKRRTRQHRPDVRWKK